MILLALLACGPKTEVEPVLTLGPMNPFPTADLLVDGQVALASADLPMADGGTPWDTSRFAWRDGFSPVQTSVVMFDVPIDPNTLPGEAAIGVGGSVRILDLETGAATPLFAELDLAPDAVESGRQALLIRPMQAMTPGHTYVVVVTDAVHGTDGEPLSTSQWHASVDEGGEAAELAEWLAYHEIDNVVWAWKLPVGDGTRPMRALAAEVGTPATYSLGRVHDADAEALPAGVWRQAEGSFPIDNWLVDDVVFALDGEGVPVRQDPASAYLLVHVPDSVRGAKPGTVPVMIFGHGILSDPGNYLMEDDDPSNVVHLADDLGVIVVASVWRGLTTDDLLHAVEVSGDFGRFPEITDMLAQGVANNLQLLKLVQDGPLLDDPMFEGLADRSTVYWYGISLGSIEGMVTLANTDRIDLAALHVGGASWSTMLERSSNWPAFEQGVTRTIPDAWDRQKAYALSQLVWDQVDPASYAADLVGRPYLWQESIGDDQVPNLTTELMMRSVDVPLAGPAVTSPYGATEHPLPLVGPAFVQFDPMLPAPPPGNRPAPVTGAHGAPRMWAGCERQVVHYFESGGEIAHFCGDAPCSADNQGE